MGEAVVNHKIEIHLLGGFSVCAGGLQVPAQRWRLRKDRNLVKLLALAPLRRAKR